MAHSLIEAFGTEQDAFTAGPRSLTARELAEAASIAGGLRLCCWPGGHCDLIKAAEMRSRPSERVRPGLGRGIVPCRPCVLVSL